MSGRSPSGQQVTQAWNATVTQSGSTVSATNVDWNGKVAAGAAASFGFIGTTTGANTVPTNFAVNGHLCGG